MIARTINALETTLKRLFFKCHNCGSCLLSQTNLICPMSCPKGLRNGPCGGSLHGECEVYDGHPCIWVQIHNDRKDIAADPIHAPFDEDLLKTSSLINFTTKADQSTRLPLPFLDLPSYPLALPAQTASLLEKRFLSRDFILTTEVRSPRKEEGLKKLAPEIESLLPWIDAFNTTSNHGGVKTVSSLETALLVKKMGADPILQICGRDVNASSFLDEAKAAYEQGVQNILCLTGDWAAHETRSRVPVESAHKRFFRMDSSQMVYELRHLRETGRSAFVMKNNGDAPRPYIGAVANPYTLPNEVALSRLAQKIACGADFIQTQIITDVNFFIEWMDALQQSGLRHKCCIIASVPIVTKRSAFDLLCRLKGILVPSSMRRLFKNSLNVEKTGLDFARGIIEKLSETGTVDGLHLTNFGATTAQMVELARFARETVKASSSLQKSL